MARTAIHPGEHLADELQELGMSAAELARQIAVPVNRVTQIINGQRAITADTALCLGHWFQTGPEVWLNLQQLYELRRAREAVGDEIEWLPRRAVGERAVPGAEAEAVSGFDLYLLLAPLVLVAVGAGATWWWVRHTR